MKNEIISAFAYKTGKLIEEIIDQETNNLQFNYKDLQARLFTFRQIYLSDKPELAKIFDNHFRIISYKDGAAK